MPLIIPCDELQAGMRLAEAFVYNTRIMLPGGKTLNNDDIDILRRKYPQVHLKIGDPVLDSLLAFEDDSRERAVASAAQQKINKCMTEVQARFSGQMDAARLNFNAVRQAAVGVIDYLKSNPASLALLNRSSSAGNYLAEHSGNVFYLSILLGSSVRDYVIRERMRQTHAGMLSQSIAMDLLPLGLGAMFMDLGMIPLQRIYEKGYVLTEEDRKQIRDHPNVAAELLPENLPAGVRMIVRSHHENFDGSGYPNQISAEDLHIFTRIVRIADAYEAATADRMYAKAKSSARAIWEMCYGPFRNCYDPVLTKVFMGLVQPFPIGAKVRLADGRYAVVVRYNRKSPFHPSAVVAFDKADHRLPKEQMIGPVRLGEGNDLRIGSFAGEDLSYLHEAAPATASTEKSREIEGVFEAVYP